MIGIETNIESSIIEEKARKRIAYFDCWKKCIEIFTTINNQL